MMVCEGSVGFPGNDRLVELCSWKGVVVKMMVCIREDGGFVFFFFLLKVVAWTIHYMFWMGDIVNIGVCCM